MDRVSLRRQDDPMVVVHSPFLSPLTLKRTLYLIPVCMHPAVLRPQVTNIGPLMRCSVAFGAREVWVVGPGRCGFYGAHRSERHLSCRQVATWALVRQLATEMGLAVVGLTQQGHVATSRPVHTRPFTGPPVLFVCPSEKVIRWCVP